MFFADLHIHSKYSMATSANSDLSHLNMWARRKGIKVLGTGDLTNPMWRSQMREQLSLVDYGIYRLKDMYCESIWPSFETPYFILTGEISCVYKRSGKTRRVHNVVILPSLETADALSEKLSSVGNICADGRPILKLDSEDLLDMVLNISPDAELVPAHIWTPHYSMFGRFSDFSSIQECFGSLSKYVHAIETGLSSDPPMNWRVSQLDSINLLSNSDAHSPAKIGREANIFSCKPEYSELLKAIRTGEGLTGTVEFFPEEGKYYMDGHRNCNVCLSPKEYSAIGGACPVCGRSLTIGVEHMVEKLADRPYGYIPVNAKKFIKTLPLDEIISASTGWSVSSKKTTSLYFELLSQLGPELYLLIECPIDELSRISPCIAEGILNIRQGKVKLTPGYDGKFGSLTFL